MSPHSIGEDNDWEAESDLNTVERANEINADAKRTSRMKAFAGRKAEQMSAIANDGNKAAESMTAKGYRVIK